MPPPLLCPVLLALYRHTRFAKHPAPNATPTIRQSHSQILLTTLYRPYYLLLFTILATATSTPPTILQMRISQGHAPPCRLRASALFTVANHRFVTGRLKRQAMSGEKMSRMMVGTIDQ